MNANDKLAELINQAIDTYATMPLVNGCRPELKYFLADYLLANGVIVPPCKVGDTVYYLTIVDTEKELNVTEIFEGVVHAVCFDGKLIWFSATYANGLFYYHNSNDFGKTVFLSLEEAEKSLAERSKQ